MPIDRRPALAEHTLAAFRAGDPDALGAVYDAYSRAVWAVAMRVLTNPALAEDATQETFLRAWRSASVTDADRDLAPWLLTIARRAAVDVWRRESRPTQGGHADEQDVVVDLPGIEGVWEAWEIARAVDELPPDEREVVRLAHYGHLTHTEIAAVVGAPVGTVKSRSHRAHRKLAGLLGHLKDSTDGSAVPRPGRTFGGGR